MTTFCTINGVRYKSISEAGRALNIGFSTVRFRLHSSNYPEYISQHHPKKGRKTFISCTIKGVEYASLASAAKKSGEKPDLILKKSQSFDCPDYVCSKFPKKKSIKIYNYKVRNKRYRTLREIANEEGLTRERIRQKIKDATMPEYQKI